MVEIVLSVQLSLTVGKMEKHLRCSLLNFSGSTLKAKLKSKVRQAALQNQIMHTADMVFRVQYNSV